MSDLQNTELVVFGLFDLVSFFLLMKFFFGGFSGLLRASNFSGRSDWLSLFRGELMEDWKETFKVSLYVLICSAIIIVEMMIVFPRP